MIEMKFKSMFFNSPKVIAAVDKATRRVLSRFGAFVRQRAKTSIRKRKKPSAPGSPPSSHVGLLKKFIWFSYEPNRRSVVIGPARLSQNNRGEAPSLLEYGGITTIRRKKRRTRVRIRARPFMGPAFEKEQRQLPSLWKLCVRTHNFHNVE
ncbi:MAG: hypothetical protein GWP14_04600 [Actinobacteria bacterium]|nr:hypothetical protein [Actinomycetota bacterium]